jgi:hypothetical protein
LKNRGTKRDGGVVGELEGGEDTENPAGPSPPSAPVSCHKIIWQDSPIVNMIGQIYINGLDLSNTEHFQIVNLTCINTKKLWYHRAFMP